MNLINLQALERHPIKSSLPNIHLIDAAAARWCDPLHHRQRRIHFTDINHSLDTIWITEIITIVFLQTGHSQITHADHFPAGSATLATISSAAGRNAGIVVGGRWHKVSAGEHCDQLRVIVRVMINVVSSGGGGGGSGCGGEANDSVLSSDLTHTTDFG